MTQSLYFQWFLCLTAIAASQNITDPCNNYINLDSKGRDVDSVTQSTPICDKDLIPGWYRFTGGSGEIATSKVSMMHCGTMSPIWMDDTLPEPGPIIEKKFCFNHMDISPNGCLWSVKSPVKNCGGYIVYKFPLTSSLCPMAVCTDKSIQPCPPGQVSKTGFRPCKRIHCQPGKWSPSGYEPCGDPFPELTKVTLSGPDELTPGEFKHVCLITSNDTATDGKFNVTWSMDGVPISHEILTDPYREAFFNLRDWEGHINQKLTCSVTAYYEHFKNHTSKELTSNSYFGGIKIEPNLITLPEGKDMNVELISTLPLNCEDPTQHQFCQLKLHTISTNLYTHGSCELTLTPTLWNSSTHQAVVPVEIASIVDPVVKPDVHTQLTVQVSYNQSVTGMNMWANTTDISIKVTITDSKPCACNCWGDPHFTDSFSYHGKYNLYHLGDFNFASDMKAPIVVQIETNTYHPTHLPIVSAVAVQTDDDVTVIDTQGGSKQPSVTSRKPPVSHMVQACGTTEYQISTPTGHRINLYLHGNPSSGFYLAVKLNFPSGIIPLGDISNTAIANYTFHEVCDINATTDGQNTFGHSGEISPKIINMFRVQPAGNLFKGALLPLRRAPVKQYCSCSLDNPDQVVQAKCSASMKVDDPLVKRSSCKVIQPTIITGPLAQTRPGEHSFTDYQPVSRQWPTSSGITETQARTKCRHDIISHVPSQCAIIKDLNVDEIVDMCAEDVLASDGYGYIAGAIQGFQAKCETAIITNIANYNKTSNGNLGVPDIVSQTCPGQCTMHGACVNGVCQCKAGWEWEDCSVKPAEPFLITGIGGGIMCDKSSSDDCFNPVLNVENIGNISRCDVEPALYFRGRPRNTPEDHYTGQYERQTGFSVACNIASQYTQTAFHAKVFKIILVPETDHQDPKYINYVVYDGICQKCLKDLTCFMKEDACLIEGKCYRSGDMKALDNHFKCDPTANIDGWSVTQSVGNVPVSVGRK